LKVFQQFSELPREQALEKLHQFSERAIKEFEDSLERSIVRNVAQKENLLKGNPLLSPSELFSLTGTHGPSIMGAKYMACVTMLLAARTGEYKLLLTQIDTMQSLIDAYIKEGGYSRPVASLEDDCIFTILMYALEQKEGKLDVDFFPFAIKQEGDGIPNSFTLTRETIPLFRWNAYVTHYDCGMSNPDDMIEQIAVYRSHVPISVGDTQMQLIIDTLKERLSK
jgi:hypothetical protein